MTQLQLDASPETCGLLSEPPRWPPTAVGSATLPPADDGYPRRHGLTRRIALGVLAVVFAIAAIPAGSTVSASRAALASGLVAASIDVGVQAATGSTEPWSAVVVPAAWRMLRQVAVIPVRLGARHGRRPAPTVVRLDVDAAIDDYLLHRRRPTPPPNDGRGRNG